LKEFLNHFVEYWVTDEYRSTVNSLRKIRIYIVSQYLGIFSYLIASAIYAFAGINTLATICLICGVVTALSLRLLKLKNGFNYSFPIQLVMGQIVVIYTVALTGGINSALLSANIMFPLIGILVYSRVVALIIALAVVLTTVGFYIAQLNGIIFISVFEGHEELASLLTINFSALFAGLICFSFSEKSKKALNEAAESTVKKKNLISIVSHDLNNHLAIINSTLELTMSADGNEKKEKFSKSMQPKALRSSRQIGAIIKNVRMLNTISEWGVQESLTPVNLLETIPSSIEDMSEFAAAKKINLISELPEYLDEIEGYNSPLRSSVFNNLISNAVKFSAKNGDVTISSSVDNDYVYIHITDSGDGIKEEFREGYREKPDVWMS
jgi:signal transduction histidine kinase